MPRQESLDRGTTIGGGSCASSKYSEMSRSRSRLSTIGAGSSSGTKRKLLLACALLLVVGIGYLLYSSQSNAAADTNDAAKAPAVGGEQSQQQCAAFPCGAHGRCVNDACVCEAGYTGKTCDTKNDPGDPVSTCDNCGAHGKCVNGMCFCSDGYSGFTCQTAPDLCAQIDCGRHGVCSLAGNCECLDGYTGIYCQSAPPCAQIDCGEHGTCSNGVCTCADGYTGSYCQIEPVLPDPCASVSCGTHGKCVDGKCTCSDQYTGDQCETAPDPCAGVSCGGHGKCNNGKCVCTDSFTGDHCEQAPDPCAGIECGSHGSCQNGKCICTDNYSGDRCQNGGGVADCTTGFGRGTTGGNSKASSPTNVDSCSKLASALQEDGPRYIRITKNLKNCGTMKVKSDKTIVGAGSSKELLGSCLSVYKAKQTIQNVIIRNLKMGFVKGGDAIQLQYAKKVWVDHCELISDMSHGKDYYDGLIDVTHGSTAVTISNNRFRNHYKTSLVGHSDSNGSEDKNIRVTYHGNYWEGTNSRNPSVRFGKAHVFNNYYKGTKGYAVASRIHAEVCVQDNVFEGVKTPVVCTASTLSKVAGKVNLKGNNVYSGGSGKNLIDSGTTTSFCPSESVIDGSRVKDSVLANAGIGKLNL